MQISQVGSCVEVGLQKKSPKCVRKEAKDHPDAPAAAVTQFLEVLGGI